MRRACVVIALVYLAVYVFAIGGPPLHSPDETRYAEIPREMLASGDWIVPHLDGLRYFEKPPLHYWITAVSLLAFGENEFAVRLPSALSVALTAWILLFLARRFCERPLVGPLAVVVYLTSILTFALGVISTLDSLFTMFLTGTLAFLFCAASEQRAGPRRGFLLLTGLCCGLAFMTKGFLAFVVPSLVAGPFLVLERRWRDLFRLAWIPAAVAVAITLPWAVAIHLREPDFWHYFVFVEHVNRFFSVHGTSQHAQPPWYFLPVLVGSQLLWLPLVPAIASGYGRRLWRAPFVRWAALWAGLPFLFFSASSGKLATYILPCLPPLAILIAVGLVGFFERRRPRVVLSAGAGVSAVLALALLAWVGTSGRWHYSDDELWRWWLAIVSLGWWALCSAVAALTPRARTGLAVYVLAPLVFMACGLWIAPPAAQGRRSMLAFLETRPGGEVRPDSIVVADGATVHAACWYLERSDLYIAINEGELAYGLSYPDSRQRYLSADQLDELVSGGPPGRDVIVILHEEHFEQWIERSAGSRAVPQPTYQAAGQGIVWARFSRDGDPHRDDSRPS